MGDGCGNEAESADEPGSRFGTLEITSRKGGKLQRPVKPEKQGADVSRKTGSHDGPERGWPREPRGSLEGPRCLFVLSRDGPPGVFKGTSSRGRPFFVELRFGENGNGGRLLEPPSICSRLEALSKPLVAFSTFLLNLDRQRSPDRRLRKIFPPRHARPSSRRSFPGARCGGPFSPLTPPTTQRHFPRGLSPGRGAFSFRSTP